MAEQESRLQDVFEEIGTDIKSITDNASSMFTTTLGDGVSTRFTVVHNLNSFNLLWDVYKTLTPRDSVIVGFERGGLNLVYVDFDSPPAIDEFTLVIRS